MRYTIYYWKNMRGGMSGKHFDKLKYAKEFALKKYNEGYWVSIYDAQKRKTGTLRFLK
jgi:hypothetical protein